jgi:hypothetical protein
MENYQKLASSRFGNNSNNASSSTLNSDSDKKSSKSIKKLNAKPVKKVVC